MAEYIEREAFKAEILRLSTHYLNEWDTLGVLAAADRIPAADVRPVPEGGIGEMSDGYHTFNGLYYQRMVLFAVLVRVYKDRAWKSWRHEDGELCFGKDNYFIVGIDTPQGSYTYHYHGEYWDLFDCVELPTAKHWDGHTEEDVTRLLSLDVRPVVRGKWEHTEDFDEYGGGRYVEWTCSKCFFKVKGGWAVRDSHIDEKPRENFCPNCGADMREES